MIILMKINALRKIRKRNNWEEEKKWGLSLLFGQSDPQIWNPLTGNPNEPNLFI